MLPRAHRCADVLGTLLTRTHALSCEHPAATLPSYFGGQVPTRHTMWLDPPVPGCRRIPVIDKPPPYLMVLAATAAAVWRPPGPGLHPPPAAPDAGPGHRLRHALGHPPSQGGPARGGLPCVTCVFSHYCRGPAPASHCACSSHWCTQMLKLLPLPLLLLLPRWLNESWLSLGRRMLSLQRVCRRAPVYHVAYR